MNPPPTGKTVPANAHAGVPILCRIRGPARAWKTDYHLGTLLDSDGRVESAVHDLAVIIVSTNQATLAPSLPAHRGGAGRRHLARPGGGRQRSGRRCRRAGRARVPGSARDALLEPRLRARQQHGVAHLRRALRALPQPGYGAARGHARADSSRSSIAAPTWALSGVRQLSADGTLYPSMRAFPSVGRVLGDALGLERLPNRPVVARRARGRPGPLRGRVRRRLDDRLVPARPPRGARECGLLRRAVLHLLRGGRLLPQGETGGLEAALPAGA